VIFHGGYGTTMELVQAGKPGLVIPFHSEQESNARRLEAAGAAQVLLPSRQEATPDWHQWPGGRFCTLIQQESDLTPDCLRAIIIEMLADESFKINAEKLQGIAQNYQGASQAVELINERLKSGVPTPAKGFDRLRWWQKLSLQW
jgi:UDP:flavonoid glycosyltransferase YjiC (YdhE family)